MKNKPLRMDGTVRPTRKPKSKSNPWGFFHELAYADGWKQAQGINRLDARLERNPEQYAKDFPVVWAGYQQGQKSPCKIEGAAAMRAYAIANGFEWND